MQKKKIEGQCYNIKIGENGYLLDQSINSKFQKRSFIFIVFVQIIYIIK